jgi:hypothetical protein
MKIYLKLILLFVALVASVRIGFASPGPPQTQPDVIKMQLQGYLLVVSPQLICVTWCVLIGYLIFRSTFMPRILGLLEGLAGLCWLTFIWPPLAHYVSPYNQILAGLGEISLMLWLLVMGVNVERWKEQASAG